MHEWVSLGESSNPLAAISNELERKCMTNAPVDTVHVVAHGRPGALRIGGQWVDSATLIANAQQLAQWSVRRIELWCCDVARDEAFIALLE